jgi:hypothetical protein
VIIKLKINIVFIDERTKGCPATKNDIELTDEIKEFVLKNRVYQIPKPPKTPKKPQTVIITQKKTNEVKEIKKREKNKNENNEIVEIKNYIPNTDISNTSDNINILSTIDERLFIIMKEQMNTEEQTLFIDNFKNYLQYGNDDTKFIISLDDIWKWVGFSNKGNAKTLLIKKFIENKDYKICFCDRRSADNNEVKKIKTRIEGDNYNEKDEDIKVLPLKEEDPLEREKINIDDPKIFIPANKETILLNVSTFKKFCMVSSTKRAKEICDYYIKMENIMNQYTKEKISELQKLCNQSNKIELIEDSPFDIKKFFWDDNLISKFNDKNVIYLALIGVIDGLFIFKYGKTKQVDIRELKQHKLTFEYFQMVHIEICDNNTFVECQFSKILESKSLNKKFIINNKTQTELFTITKEHSLEKIIDIVKELVKDHPLESIKEKDSELIKLKEYYENEKIKRDYEFQLEKQKLISELEKQKLINELEKQKLISELEKKELEIFYLKK